jgi:hypothetical protein
LPLIVTSSHIPADLGLKTSSDEFKVYSGAIWHCGEEPTGGRDEEGGDSVNRTKVLLVAGVVAVGVVAGTGAAIAAADDEADIPITGEALTKASAAALAHTGGGSVTDTEVGDEESFYEVEVTLDDGRQVDVQLDEAFNVVGDEVEAEPDDD